MDISEQVRYEVWHIPTRPIAYNSEFVHGFSTLPYAQALIKTHVDKPDPRYDGKFEIMEHKTFRRLVEG